MTRAMTPQARQSSLQITRTEATQSEAEADAEAEAEEEAEAAAEIEALAEYTLEELEGRHLRPSHGSKLLLLTSELRGLGQRESREKLLQRLIVSPDDWRYRLWTKFILVWAVYSSFFTPLEFGFFRGLPQRLFFLDIAGQIAFFFDIALHFFVAYRDSHTYRMIYKPTPIALRYFKSGFIFDILACLPWDAIYKARGHKEEVRYLLWIRLTRVRKVTDFFHKLEKDIRVNYLFTRIVKLIVVELYCTHTAACIFYYLATTYPESQEGYTWIGSLKLGDYSFSHFREIDFFTRYLTSLYFAIVTMATVGYGDIHAVNAREMVFIMIYVSFDMILGAYLIGNMTALIVKGSKTERFRDKMKDLMQYMNRIKIGRDIREEIKGHVRLQYESSYAKASVLQDLPVSIRAKIFQTLYKPLIGKVALFKGCSTEFLNQIVSKVEEEFFLPGEVILEQGNAVDQLYFVSYGLLEGVVVGEDGSEETILSIKSKSSFGEVAILCNIPQPYTVRVCELCRLLRLDKQSFTNSLEVCYADSRIILNNLMEGQSAHWSKQLESDVTSHLLKQEAELALRLNSAAHYGDLYLLKNLIRAGADPKKTDYDGRSPLHLAASRGYCDIVSFLIQERVDVNLSDKFGSTPLLEAIKEVQDRVASLLYENGARLCLKDAGSKLCTAVAEGNSDFIKRVLLFGADPNSKDYDCRTPLHIAAADGLYLIAKMLIDSGASVFSMDRWGSTPLDEARKSGSRSLMMLLEDAKGKELLKNPGHVVEEVQGKDKMHPRRCTVFPFHPWDSVEKRKEGVVMWIPRAIEDLISSSKDLLNCSFGSRILSEDGGRILDVDMISDCQKLYLVDDHEPNSTRTS